MFQVIKLDPNEITFNYEDDNWFGSKDIKELFEDPILNNKNFYRTFATINNTSVIDLEQRSSWTHNKKFIVSSIQADNYFENNNIINNNNKYQLLKYEKDDFFNIHLDTKQNDNHKYTCLILLKDDNNDYEGGELILSDKDNIFNININSCVMIIFSLDLFHKITPVTKGVRYVLKKPLFNDSKSNFDTDSINSFSGGS
jgi:predicted 2-oxoglutarate/Fe(II)-dependent dioxygenase YbiX